MTRIILTDSVGEKEIASPRGLYTQIKIKKNLNHADHINLRHLRAIEFPATS